MGQLTKSPDELYDEIEELKEQLSQVSAELYRLTATRHELFVKDVTTDNLETWLKDVVGGRRIIHLTVTPSYIYKPEPTEEYINHLFVIVQVENPARRVDEIHDLNTPPQLVKF